MPHKSYARFESQVSMKLTHALRLTTEQTDAAQWRGNCALEELFARRERLAGGVYRCGAVAARRAAWNLRRRSLGRADVPARGGAAGAAAPPGGYAGGCGLPQRGQGDGRLDGRVGVGCAAAAVDGRAPARANILIGPGGRGVLAGFDIAVDIAVDSGVRTTEQYLATTRHRVGWTPGFEGWRRRAAPRRQTWSRWAGPSLRCGTSASLRCVTSAPRQSARRLRRLRRRWTRSWRRSRCALEELT